MDKIGHGSAPVPAKRRREERAWFRANRWTLVSFAVLTLIMAAIAPNVDPQARKVVYGCAALVGLVIAAMQYVLAEWFIYSADPAHGAGFQEWLLTDFFAGHGRDDLGD